MYRIMSRCIVKHYVPTPPGATENKTRLRKKNLMSQM